MATNVPLKVVVVTDKTRSSGNQGGVPMFSQSGRRTCADEMAFQEIEERTIKVGGPIKEMEDGEDSEDDVLE